ncbi:hypothetical protein CFC21_057745 [Triticum aestivum]|uniref:F-box domain-containing protein n=2 Tax=Triticum aestivum TaxID=4565 RepID=A0A9R1GM54_WHEAT|nr:hypothetical protein CFC21_057745 [Triticum aestivum]
MATLSPGQRQQPGVDRLSALPDELLVTILDGLDTRSAVATTVLAKRWTHLPRLLSALEFRVTDMFPPPVYQQSPSFLEQYAPAIMARYNDAIDRFMEAAHADGSYIPQPGRRLRLEFFDPDEPAFVDRLIGTAVRSWGVEDLEVIVKPVAHHIAYFFPHHYLDDESAQFIRSLTLGGCSLLPPLHRYGKLTALVLQDISPSVPVAAYAGVFSRCPGLRSVHLRRCHPETDNNIPSVMEVDAPASGIIELVVYHCSFQAIRLLALPALERLECSGSPVSLAFGIIPRLAHVVLSLGFFILEGDPWDDRYDYTLDELLVAVNPAAVTVTDLVLRFTGTYRWVEPWLDGVTPFLVLRRLQMADVPSNWDVSWAYLLLEAAPSLEVLHVSVTPCAEDSQRDVDIMWRPSKYRHRHLKELVIVGFELTPTQACLVRLVMKTCKALRRVVLMKGGRIEDRGLGGGWEVVAPQDNGWSDDEKVAAERAIKKVRYFKLYGHLFFA